VVIDASTEIGWTAVGDAASYRVQLARAADFGELLIDRDQVESTRLQLAPLARGIYFWRVASVDAAGDAGPWSVPQRFRIKPPPGAIAAAEVRRKSVEVRWSGEPGQRFLVQVARTPGFDRLVNEQATELPQASLPRHGPGAYYVRVQAIDADGYVGRFTPARRFVVPLPWWALVAPLLLIPSL
jgi:hypothetical protein